MLTRFNSILIKQTLTFIVVALSSTSLYTIAAEKRHGLLLNSELSFIHDDNIFRALSKVEDSTLTFSPTAQFLSSIGKHDFSINYSGDFAGYKKNSFLNYNTHDLETAITFDHSYKLSSNFSAYYTSNIEQPNSTNAITDITKAFNKNNEKGLKTGVSYGKLDSNGQIVLAFSYADKNYTNNQQNFRDFTKTSASGTFYYRLSTYSRLLIQAHLTDYKYKDTNNNQSSSDKTLLTGVAWQTSATTTGEFKVGYQSKDYELENLIDIDGLSYVLDLTWSPQTYTAIKLGSSKTTTESAIVGQNGYKTTSYYAEASHDLTTRTNLFVNLKYDEDDLNQSTVNTSITNRTDKTKELALGIEHSLRDWLTINLDYSYKEKNSDNQLFNFDSNTVQLSLKTLFD